MVRIILGVLLLATAGLKIHGLYTDPYSQESILLSPRMIVAVIELEVLLGLWLLSGFAKRAAWVAALAFFALAAAGSLYLAIEGQASCGCFGRVEVSPWITAALDFVMILVLGVCRPTFRIATPAESPLVLKAALGAAVLVAMVLGAFFLAAGDPAQALATLRGESLTVDPPLTNLGEGKLGDERSFAIRLTNHTTQSVRLVGGTTSCRCVTTSDLPLTIAPNQAQTITVQMRFRGSPGRFVHRYVLYAELDEQRVVVARFRGHLVERASP